MIPAVGTALAKRQDGAGSRRAKEKRRWLDEQRPQAGQAQELALDFSGKRHIIIYVRRVD